MGSVALLPWIAHPVFCGLIISGWVTEEISRAGTLIFVAAWVAGFFVQRLLLAGSLLFSSYVAILDIVLVLLVFKADVRLR